MVNRSIRAVIIGSCAVALTACASSLPSNIEYKTSLRSEQGFAGHADRMKAGNALLSAGGVTDPELALRKALPGADVNVRTWGLHYFSENWSRYQVVLSADIQRGDVTKKCRKVSSETPANAPTLTELRDNDGAAFQALMDELVAACVVYANDLT